VFFSYISCSLYLALRCSETNLLQYPVQRRGGKENCIGAIREGLLLEQETHCPSMRARMHHCLGKRTPLQYSYLKNRRVHLVQGLNPWNVIDIYILEFSKIFSFAIGIPSWNKLRNSYFLIIKKKTWGIAINFVK